jgi:hypothetical protein
MGIRHRLFLRLTAAVFLLAATAYGQDSPPLGDLARQQRQQKEKSKPAPGKDGKAAKVITNEEIHAQAGATQAPAVEEHATSSSTSAASSNQEVKQTAETWTSQIQGQKSNIASLQKQIEALNESIHFAPGNCVENCAQWNERQQEKQRQAEAMQAQLEEQKKRLEAMQDAARKQGYGSSVYEP